MQGARGLLISITGGKDLTLYEVDEAATRIREEVDADANIIVGATFDESLDGIIRVSVVATGIDHARPAPPRARLRPGAGSPQARPAVPPRRPRSVLAAARSRQRITSAHRRIGAAPQGRQRLADAPNGSARRVGRIAAGVSRPSAAPPAAAGSPWPPRGRDDVTIRADSRRSRACSPSRRGQAPAPAEASLPKVFIPPQPERPAIAPPRMRDIRELPVPAQNEFRARRGEMPEAEHPEKRRLTLLQRLAAVGLGRREDEPEADRARPVRPEPARRPRRAAGAAAPGRAAGAATGVGIRRRARAARARRPRPPGCLCTHAGRGRSAGYPGFPPPAGELSQQRAAVAGGPDFSR